MILALLALVSVGAIGSWLDYGAPCQSDVIAVREGYVVGFNNTTHCPDWTMHRITSSDISRGDVKRTEDFRHDPQIPQSAELSDYKGSGWARGHMVPAGDMTWSPKAMSETFYLSNIIPQNARNNSGAWNRIEQKVRVWAMREKSLWIITGPIYDKSKKPRTIGETAVRVPDAIFKIVLDETPPKKMIAFISPNEDTEAPPRELVVTVDEVERRTGFDFFPKMLRVEQSVLESSSIYERW